MSHPIIVVQQKDNQVKEPTFVIDEDEGGRGIAIGQFPFPLQSLSIPQEKLDTDDVIGVNGHLRATGLSYSRFSNSHL